MGYDGVISSGAHDDLRKVAGNAYLMVSRLGMSKKLYNVNVEDLHNQLAQQSGGMRTSYPSEKTKELMKKETIGRDEVVAILGPRPFAEKFTYEELVADTKENEEDLSLPPG